MPRAARPFLPGACFHITSRTQGREPWLQDHRPFIGDLIARSIRLGRATLLAYATMPNHLHLVLQQGPVPLGRIMQMILQPLAMRIRRTQDREGHIFERRYRAKICGDGEYLRNAIVYTNLNPMRAGLCSDPAGYAWCSHPFYLTGQDSNPELTKLLQDGRGMLWFDHADSDAIGASSYQQWSGFWQSTSTSEVAATLRNSSAPEARPLRFTDDSESHARRLDRDRVPLLLTHDIGAAARHFLSSSDPSISVEEIRGNRKCRSLVNRRRRLIRDLSGAGFRNRQIANFLCVHDSVVSVTLRRK